MSDIVRWAIRFYALAGPWHPGEDADRQQAIGVPSASLITGPKWGGDA